VVAGLGLVLVVLVGWGIARRQLRRVGAGRDRRSGTTLVLSLPPVPAPRPRAAGPVPIRVEPLAERRPDVVADAAHVARPPSLQNVVLMTPVAAPRPIRRCGHCRAVGHTRPTCPRLTGALRLPQL
jgi:hypothetical protein